ncbi:MAG: hypothetical protein LBU45_06290 [Azoarcus sp.]|jgi:hypothetical protein|nr:hypothetical protein [Azoarcus sp.]
MTCSISNATLILVTIGSLAIGVLAYWFKRRNENRPVHELESPKSLSAWVRYLVFISTAIFLVPSLVAAGNGMWQAALAGFVVGGAILFFDGAGWFYYRYPVPPPPPGSSRSVLAQIRFFKQHCSGWQGKPVFYGIPALLFITLGLWIAKLF